MEMTVLGATETLTKPWANLTAVLCPKQRFRICTEKANSQALYLLSSPCEHGTPSTPVCRAVSCLAAPRVPAIDAQWCSVMSLLLRWQLVDRATGKTHHWFPILTHRVPFHPTRHQRFLLPFTSRLQTSHLGLWHSFSYSAHFSHNLGH